MKKSITFLIFFSLLVMLNAQTKIFERNGKFGLKNNGKQISEAIYKRIDENDIDTTFTVVRDSFLGIYKDDKLIFPVEFKAFTGHPNSQFIEASKNNKDYFIYYKKNGKLAYHKSFEKFQAAPSLDINNNKIEAFFIDSDDKWKLICYNTFSNEFEEIFEINQSEDIATKENLFYTHTKQYQIQFNLTKKAFSIIEDSLKIRDKDLDLVIDDIDNCPTEKGVISNTGCPWEMYDKPAQFKYNWIQFLSMNIEYPKVAVKKKITGIVIVKFIVNIDGSISEVKSISGPLELREAAENAVKKSSGMWSPAVDAKGTPVKSYGSQKINFSLH